MLNDSRRDRHDVPSLIAPVDDSTDLISALLAENELLRVRTTRLESGLAEYRRQMAEVLTSASWRVTSPLRMAAGRGRMLREMPRRWRRKRTQAQGARTAGLFPPAPGTTSAFEIAARLALPPGSLVDPRPPVLPREPTAPVLVVAHVFYPEVWHDIADRLARMPKRFDLIVSLVDGYADWLKPTIAEQFPQALVEVVPNRGRDIASLVSLANRRYFDGYEAILKVHTKRSPHRLDGDAWRIRLLDAVLPSPTSVAHMIELLRRNPDVGIIAPTGSITGPEHWGSNVPIVEALASRLPMAFDPDELQFAAGSMFWCRPWVLQRLADFALEPEDFQDEAGHTDGTTAHALERLIGVMATSSGLDIVPTDEVSSRLQRCRTPLQAPRVLAFYLPQYHRSPQNDAWWGEGFTDWVNVDKATPLYDGHLQPQAPGELGHYDLTDPDVMRQQAALAAKYGIGGFVMHHYWFDGTAVLDQPLRQLLSDPSIDFPFALCWANENWTRRWDGLDDDVLIAQTYPPGWADAFFDDLLPALRDPRYLTVAGKPLLVLYRVGQIPQAGAVIAGWRRRAATAGLAGLHVLAVVPSRDFEKLPDGVAGALDGLVQFPPGSGIGLHSLRAMTPGYGAGNGGDVLSYDAAVDGADLRTRGHMGPRVHPGVMPGWDNTPRRDKAAYVFHGSNPMTFRRWVAQASRAAVSGGGESLLFVNAWNEWAEGAHLEPDARFGSAALESVSDGVGLARHISPGDDAIHRAGRGVSPTQ